MYAYKDARFSVVTRWLLFALLVTCLLPATVEARRTVVDGNDTGQSYEVTGDANDGETVTLPFAIDFGAGLQSDGRSWSVLPSSDWGSGNFGRALFHTD